MRALRWPDAFPAGDLGLLKAWGETLGAASARRGRGLAALARYAAIYLWESQHITHLENHDD